MVVGHQHPVMIARALDLHLRANADRDALGDASAKPPGLVACDAVAELGDLTLLFVDARDPAGVGDLPDHAGQTGYERHAAQVEDASLLELFEQRRREETRVEARSNPNALRDPPQALDHKRGDAARWRRFATPQLRVQTGSELCNEAQQRRSEER